MKTLAFTLVELIVVVTILAILATIGFVSYSGYLSGVRDTNRIASLTAISDGLELYRTKNDLPDPDDAIDIQIEGVDIAHQGYVGSNVLQTIEYSKAGKDPKDDSYYSYYLTDDKKHYQLMAFLEESDNLDTSLSPTLSFEWKGGNFISSLLLEGVGAVEYKTRYPKVYGKKLGILTNSDNTPVQEIISGPLNLTGGTNTLYKARLTDTELIEGTGSLLKGISKNASCMRLRQFGERKSGLYTINPAGTSTGSVEVYCDMVTQGGGWTRTHVLFYNAATTRDQYKILFTQNTDFSGSGYTINIEPIHYNEFAYLTGIGESEVEFLDTGNLRTVGNKDEGMSEWLRAYKMDITRPFTRENWYYYTTLQKRMKETITVGSVGTGFPHGFRQMHTERLLSGNNGSGDNTRRGTNMPFGKQGLNSANRWCYGGQNRCDRSPYQTWASLWIR